MLYMTLHGISEMLLFRTASCPLIQAEKHFPHFARKQYHGSAMQPPPLLLYPGSASAHAHAHALVSCSQTLSSHGSARTRESGCVRLLYTHPHAYTAIFLPGENFAFLPYHVWRKFRPSLARVWVGQKYFPLTFKILMT